MKEYFGDTWSDVRKEEYIGSGSSNAFLRQVYMVMSIGLGLTALAAWYISQKLIAGEWLFIMEWHTAIAFAPLIFVLALNFGLEKMSASTASVVFGVFAVVMGVGLAADSTHIHRRFHCQDLLHYFRYLPGNDGSRSNDQD